MLIPSAIPLPTSYLLNTLGDTLANGLVRCPCAIPLATPLPILFCDTLGDTLAQYPWCRYPMCDTLVQYPGALPFLVRYPWATPTLQVPRSGAVRRQHRTRGGRGGNRNGRRRYAVSRLLFTRVCLVKGPGCLCHEKKKTHSAHIYERRFYGCS